MQKNEENSIVSLLALFYSLCYTSHSFIDKQMVPAHHMLSDQNGSG